MTYVRHALIITAVAMWPIGRMFAGWHSIYFETVMLVMVGYALAILRIVLAMSVKDRCVDQYSVTLDVRFFTYGLFTLSAVIAIGKAYLLTYKICGRGCFTIEMFQLVHRNIISHIFVDTLFDIYASVGVSALFVKLFKVIENARWRSIGSVLPEFCSSGFTKYRT